ncbi:MAG TPA: hypothetical protein PKH10_04755 [bacterium]|nr:hypothetical protein [bacterium]
MLKHIMTLSLLSVLCAAAPLSAVESFRAPYTTVCVNSDGVITCEEKTIQEIPLTYGEPVQIEVSYTNTCDATSCSTETPVLFTLTKSLPQDISPLTFLHTVRTLSALPAAQNGTANSPYAAYRAYTVGAARRDYVVNVTLSQGATVLDTFDISAKEPRRLMIDDDHPVLARLLDETRSPLTDDTPAGGLLFVPVKQDGTLEPVYEGLLLPQAVAADIVDARQLNQLRDADLAKIATDPNAETAYLVRYQRAFRNAVATMGSSLMLVREVPDRAFSTARLELDRAVVGGVRREAVGWIQTAGVEPFEAMSKNGRLSVTVENVGSVTAAYMVSVLDCSSFVGVPIITRFVDVAAGAQSNFVFEIPLSGDTADQQACHVMLQSLTGRVFDDVELFFTPSATDTTRVQY